CPDRIASAKAAVAPMIQTEKLRNLRSVNIFRAAAVFRGGVSLTICSLTACARSSMNCSGNLQTNQSEKSIRFALLEPPTGGFIRSATFAISELAAFGVCPPRVRERRGGRK